jgi:hypothetical protein
MFKIDPSLRKREKKLTQWFLKFYFFFFVKVKSVQIEKKKVQTSIFQVWKTLKDLLCSVFKASCKKFTLWGYYSKGASSANSQKNMKVFFNFWKFIKIFVEAHAHILSIVLKK